MFYKRVEPTAVGFLFQSMVLGVFFFIWTNLSAGLTLSQLRFWLPVKAILIYLSTLRYRELGARLDYCMLISFSASIAIYRLYFNPLRRFPGDKLRALTKWGHYIDANRGTTLHVLMKQHRELGDFVRIGPNEISISDPSFIPIIHGNKSRFPKGPWYDDMNGDVVQSLIEIRDFDKHKSQRKVWDEVFTPRALKVYEGRILTVLDNLASQFVNAAKTGELLDLALWSERLLVDSTGKIAFVSSSPCLLESILGILSCESGRRV